MTKKQMNEKIKNELKLNKLYLNNTKPTLVINKLNYVQ